MELGAEKDHLHQRFVLYIIYLVSGPWTPVEGRLEWGSPVHECEWEGIYCKDVEELEAELEGRIEELLEVGREDGIKIDIPRRIANRLELRQRLVSGEVPAEFSLLYYLQHLDLENNKLVGGLPAPLYKLFNLETLFLEQNDLTNVDAIGEYRHLEHVALGKNNFRGTIPTSFANLKKLKTLYLHTNAFSGQVFDVLQEFTQLELLDIAFNEFSGTLPSEMGNMKNLTSAFLGHNQFEGTLPDALANCKNLQEFQMDGSHDMTGPIPSFLGSLPKLRFLKLDTCAFTGVLPMSLGNLQNLEFLDVNSNELRGKIPSQLGKATSLKTLGLANNGFQGTVPSHLGSLTKLGESTTQLALSRALLYPAAPPPLTPSPLACDPVPPRPPCGPPPHREGVLSEHRPRGRDAPGGVRPAPTGEPDQARGAVRPVRRGVRHGHVLHPVLVGQGAAAGRVAGEEATRATAKRRRLGLERRSRSWPPCLGHAAFS